MFLLAVFGCVSGADQKTSGVTIMPTDIALVLKRKAEAEAQGSKDALTVLIIVCLWVTFGLLFAALLSNHGLDPALAQALFLNG